MCVRVHLCVFVCFVYECIRICVPVRACILCLDGLQCASVNMSASELLMMFFFALQFVIYSTLVAIVTTTCAASGPPTDSLYQLCVATCRILFVHCLRVECHGQTWPLMAPQKCINERTVCNKGCQQMKLFRP